VRATPGRSYINQAVKYSEKLGFYNHIVLSTDCLLTEWYEVFSFTVFIQQGEHEESTTHARLSRCQNTIMGYKAYPRYQRYNVYTLSYDILTVMVKLVG